MSLSGPTAEALIAQSCAIITALSLIVALMFLARWRWKAALTIFVGIALVYAAVWHGVSEKLSRAWFFLQADNNRTYEQYRSLVWSEAYFPGNVNKETDAFLKIVYRDDANPGQVAKSSDVLSVYYALVEKPSAKSVLLLGDDAKSYRPYFEKAGLICSEKAEGDKKYDVIFVASRPDWMVFSDHPERGDFEKNLKSLSPKGVLAWCIDIRLASPGRFKSYMEAFPLENAHLWMSDNSRWVLTARANAKQIKLSNALEIFSRDNTIENLSGTFTDTLPDLFASYAGSKEEIMPALEAVEAEGKFENFFSAVRLAFQEDASHFRMRPEFIVKESSPKVDWIVKGESDDEICKLVMERIEKNFAARRNVIRGEIALRKGDSTAVESFSRAALVNRGDSMLRSRRSIIKTQAKNFLKFGNYAAAALSYDCLVMIDPNDVESLVAYAKVLSKLGKGDLAEKARERAKELLKNEK
jgi:hypothetical protein